MKTILSLALVLLFGSALPAQTAGVRLVSIEPTVRFVRDGAALRQVAEVTLENPGEPVEAQVVARLDSLHLSTPLGRVPRGKTTASVHIPDVTRPTPVEFVLSVGGKAQDARKITWQPQRHWEVCLVPIAHHDLGYTDTIENVLRRYDGFYDDVLRFCRQTDDWPEEAKFRYSVEGSWSIQHFAENRPKEVAETLGKYLREGRIEIHAFYGNEITGLCSHEELIRSMYPSFRFQRQLGATIRTGSITDIPGLSWGLPTVLAGAGVKYFFAGLPDYFKWGRDDIHTFWDEAAVLRQPRPDAFRWEGPDGKSVLVYYQGSYGCWSPGSYAEAINDLPGMLAAMQAQKTPFSVMRYGYGCGDNVAPDLRVSRVVREWNSKWAYPKLIVATSAMFFQRLETQCRDLRVFRGELPHTDYVVGATCTAEETGINRLTHDRLNAAEKLAAAASVLAGREYPADAVRDAYDNMLLYDEHTWGMSHQVGPVQDWDWADKARYAYKAAGLAERVLVESARCIAEQVAREHDDPYFVVFNPLSVPRSDVVRVAGFRPSAAFELVDLATGKATPCQAVELDWPGLPAPYAAQRYARGQFHEPERFDLVFVAEDVPPLGYKTYRLVPRSKPPALSGSISIGGNTLENRFFKVTLNPQTGAVESLVDKELSRELVDPAARHKLNQLVVKWVQTGKEDPARPAKIRKGQAGPVYGSLITSGQAAACPQVTQEIVLYDKLKRIDLANRILKDSTPMVEIYFAFPFAVDGPQFRFEGSNSVIEPLKDQFPGSNSNYYAVQHWADVSDGRRGVALASIESHLMEFGGLWPCYVSQAHHGFTPPGFGQPFVSAGQMTKGHVYAFAVDNNFRTNFPPLRQGDMLFRYSITTHAGDWRQGGVRDFGWAVANPLVPVEVRGKSLGRLPSSLSFCQVEPANVFLLALKRAEDGAGLILRLTETSGREARARVTLPRLKIKRAFRTNLVEENQGELPAREHEVAVAVKPFEPVTLRIQPE